MSVSSEPVTEDELGPIDFLAVEFPGAHFSAAGFEQLLSLADQGVIAILDLEFIGSGLLDSADVDQIAAEIDPGSVACVVIYEDRWAVNLVNTWRRDGARFIADGGLAADDVVAALDEAEAS